MSLVKLYFGHVRSYAAGAESQQGTEAGISLSGEQKKARNQNVKECSLITADCTTGLWSTLF